MHGHAEVAFYTKLSQAEEDHVLENMEMLVQSAPLAAYEYSDVASNAGPRRRRRYPLVLISAAVLVAALVPASFLKSDLLARVAHQVTNG